MLQTTASWIIQIALTCRFTHLFRSTTCWVLCWAFYVRRIFRHLSYEYFFFMRCVSEWESTKGVNLGLQRPQKNTTTRIWIAFRNSRLAEFTNKGVNLHSKDITQIQQQRPKLAGANLTRHASLYKGHNHDQRYILKKGCLPVAYLPFQAHLAFVWPLRRTNLLLCLVILQTKSHLVPFQNFHLACE